MIKSILLIAFLVFCLLAVLALIKPAWVKMKGRIVGFLLYGVLAFATMIGAGVSDYASMTEDERRAWEAERAAQDKVREAELAVKAEQQAAEDKVKAEQQAAESKLKEAEDKAKAEQKAIEDKAKTLAEEEAKKPYITTATKLDKDYEANEVATDEKIGARPVQITGIIAGINKDFLNNIVIELAANNPFMPARLTMEDSEKSTASAAAKGNKVTIICQKVYRSAGSPVGSGCVFKP
jgi:hypothetical protein